MQIKYYPYSATQPYGFAIGWPDNPPTGPMPWMFFSHGMGDLSAGTIEDLDNKIKGYDFDGPSGPLPRQFAPVHPDMIKQVDKRGWALIWVAYPKFFEPSMFGQILDILNKDFRLAPKGLDTGFSLGSGSGIKRTKDATQCQRIACAAYCAPTNEGSGSWANPVKAGTLMHLFCNAGDTTTPPSITKAHVSGYNGQNPPIKANYTIQKDGGHGAVDWAYADKPPAQPGGEGVTNLAETIYDWYADVSVNGPRPMKTGTVTTPTTPVPPQTGTLNAMFNITEGQQIATGSYDLDAGGTVGATQYFWELNPVNIPYGAFALAKTGVANALASKTTLRNLKNGEYTLQLTASNAAGQKAQRKVKFTVVLDGTEAPVRTVTGITGKNLTFSDGTSEAIITVTTAKGTYTV